MMKPCEGCEYYFREDFELVKTCHAAEYGDPGEYLPCEREED